MTRERKEIEQLLEEEWNILPERPAVELAVFLLPFYDNGIKEAHTVISTKEDFDRLYSDAFEINRTELERISTDVGKTEYSEITDAEVVLRIVTLMGWMHTKNNLGIETLHVEKNGRCYLEKRKVLSRNIFLKFPDLRY